MTTISTADHFTPDDVLALEEQGLYELVDGKLVEKTISSVASRTAGLVAGELYVFVRSTGAGQIFPEQSFKCFPLDPEKTRRPDVAFILAAKTASVPSERHVTVVPDIAIEVISPTDKIYELDEKLEDYRSAGVNLVWVVNPNSRTVRIYRPDHTVTELTENDTLTGESVLPGFAVKVSEFLPTAK